MSMTAVLAVEGFCCAVLLIDIVTEEAEAKL